MVEEAPERELVRDRVDVREAGEVTDDRADRAATAPAGRQEAARRVAATYLQGALPCQLEHLPVEQEEPGETELVDERELGLQAIARPGEQQSVAWRIAVGEGVVADRRELPDRGLGTVGEVGVAVAELLGEVELQALRELDGAGCSGGVDAGEAFGGLCRGTQDALAIAAPLLLTAVERGAAADRHERVLEKRASRRVGMHVAGGDGVDAEMLGEVAQGGVAAHVPPLVGTLQLDEEPVAAERPGEPGGSLGIAHGEPVAGTSGKADEAVSVLLDESLSDGRRQRLPILTTHSAGARMRLGEDAAQVRVAPARLDEQRDVRCSRSGAECHLGAGDRSHTETLRRVGELERAVDTVVVGERERRIAELGCTGDELFRQRGSVEERVRRVAVELDVRHAGVGLKPGVGLKSGVGRRIVDPWTIALRRVRASRTSSTRSAPGTRRRVPRRCSGCRA